MLPLWLSIVLFIVILVLVYVLYMSRQHGQLKKLGFDGPKPVPLFGNMSRETFVKRQQRFYHEYKHKKAYGLYDGGHPRIEVSDLDLVKDILVKYFSCFTNRRQSTIDEDGPMGQAMTRLNDNKWKHVRSTVSPTFSTGKIKLMSKHVEATGKQLVENLIDKQEKNEAVELKDLISCFAMDVIARAGFGVEVDSLKDPQNKFVVSTQRLLNRFGKFFVVIIFFPFLLPVFTYLKIPLFDQEGINAIVSFVDEAMSFRRQEDSKKRRGDFVDLLLNAEHENITDHDGSSKEEQEALKTDEHWKGLSKVEIQAQALIFIIASYDTVSAALSFTFFLLALHPECIAKIREELDEKVGKESLNYENVQSLTYLDMCLNEGLRMYPPGFTLERHCGQEVEIQGFKFPKDYIVSIPVYAIHHDPEIWPDPETFNPDRFSPENKAKRHQYAHLPFGNGPRNCIGMRLALLEMKIALAAVLQVMTPVSCEKTVYPVKLQKLRMKAEDGLWVKFEKRT